MAATTINLIPTTKPINKKWHCISTIDLFLPRDGDTHLFQEWIAAVNELNMGYMWYAGWRLSNWLKPDANLGGYSIYQPYLDQYDKTCQDVQDGIGCYQTGQPDFLEQNLKLAESCNLPFQIVSNIVTGTVADLDYIYQRAKFYNRDVFSIVNGMEISSYFHNADAYISTIKPFMDYARDKNIPSIIDTFNIQEASSGDRKKWNDAVKTEIKKPSGIKPAAGRMYLFDEFSQPANTTTTIKNFENYIKTFDVNIKKFIDQFGIDLSLVQWNSMKDTSKYDDTFINALYCVANYRWLFNTQYSNRINLCNIMTLKKALPSPSEKRMMYHIYKFAGELFKGNTINTITCTDADLIIVSSTNPTTDYLIVANKTTSNKPLTIARNGRSLTGAKMDTLTVTGTFSSSAYTLKTNQTNLTINGGTVNLIRIPK